MRAQVQNFGFAWVQTPLAMMLAESAPDSGTHDPSWCPSHTQTPSPQTTHSPEACLYKKQPSVFNWKYPVANLLHFYGSLSPPPPPHGEQLHGYMAPHGFACTPNDHPTLAQGSLWLPSITQKLSFY